MRGVLAVVVMMLHLGLNPLVAKLSHGMIREGLWTLSVDFFFILSGFVLFYSLSRARPSFRDYMVKRLRRLAPVFLLGLAIMLVVGPGWPAKVIITNLLMVQPYLMIELIDHPSWSIPFELFLPALLLPALGPLDRLGDRWGRVLLGGFLVAVAVTSVALALDIDHRFWRALVGLGAGMMLGLLRQRGAVPASHPLLVYALFAGCLTIMLVAQRLPAVAALFPFCAATCILFGSSTRTLFSTAPFQALGRWSYSIYLLHIPMLRVVERLFHSADGSVKLKILVVVSTLVASAIVYRWIELPLMKGGLRMPARAEP